MSVAMYLITAAGNTIQIPVLPEKLEVSSPGKNKAETVLGLGEVLLLRERGLRTVSWESFFPAGDGPYVTGRRRVPLQLVRDIQNARDTKKPIRFLLLGTDLDVNTQMGVESFDYQERGGEPGDIYYSIKLSEWREYGAKKMILSQNGGVTSASSRSGTPGVPGSYTVVSGDSLWAIAKRFYGAGDKWKGIYEANKPIIGANPNRIYPGQVLMLR